MTEVNPLSPDFLVYIRDERDAQRLISGGRGAILLPLNLDLKELEQFELITWLIVR